MHKSVFLQQREESSQRSEKSAVDNSDIKGTCIFKVNKDNPPKGSIYSCMLQGRREKTKSCSQQDGEDLEVFMSGASNGEAAIVN